jgi:protocatechuate 3,4-dioxygenase alpha subunit
MKSGQTPSQTVGPFFAYGLVPEQYGYPLTQVANGTIAGEGPRISVTGQVLDGNNAPIIDALIEIWQAGGRFARYGTGTSPDQSYTFNLAKPLGRSLNDAPHVSVIVFMRGLLSHLYTRIYFDDEAEANKADKILQSTPASRRHTLIAKSVGPGQYRFDIHLQGEHETVFFDL